MGSLIVMTAITGKPTAEKICSYLAELKENGIDEVMLYPRSGCEIEYLSEEWFCTVGNFIESARALQMHVWLYDDFNWPSGDAGGRVTAVPEYRLRAISVKGAEIGRISYRSNHNSGLFGEKYFPDLLSADAVDYFIKCTHEEYYKRFKEHFGTVIKGIFTDEPSVGYCCRDGFIPYYDGMEEDYLQLYGHGFYVDMRTLGDEFYLNAVSLVSERFRACYVERLDRWCREHNVLMTGHLMCDNELFWSVQHNGNLLKNLSGFSMPGIDEIDSDFKDKREMALFGVAEYVSGENGAMAELFALGPCDMSYAKRRAMIYLAACHKIDKYFLAISHMDMRGNLLVKDYFSNFSADQPDFRGIKELSRESEITAKLAKKDYDADVYVRFPYEISAKSVTGYVDMEPLLSLINDFTRRQIQWKFSDVEFHTDVPTVEYKEGAGFYVNHRVFDASQLTVEPLLTDKNGHSPDGFFVRRFKDGDFVIINLFADEGEYLVNGEKVYIEKYGVYNSESRMLEVKRREINKEISIKYPNSNAVRAMFVNSQSRAEIVCESDVELTFAVRRGAEALLNGKRIACDKTGDALPRGMKEFYGFSTGIRLDKGVNVLESGNDYKYMPSVIVIGDFEFITKSGDTCRIFVKDRNEKYSCGSQLYGYGSVELITEADIPKEANGIEIKGADLYTEVYLDNVRLAVESGCTGRFRIDKAFGGQTVELKTVQYSSLAPIFGDVSYWDKTVESCGWRGTPSTENKSFGFLSVNILF